MRNDLRFEEITLEHIDELARLYVDTFNAEPWNDAWTAETAARRLRQMMNAETAYGLCAYCGDTLCGAILGCMEQYYNGIMFNLKEFWVKNDLRGRGIGTRIYEEFEARLRQRQVNEIFLFTAKGDHTEHFYHKQNMKTSSGMIIMSKRFS